jgi:hypothetical protein
MTQRPPRARRARRARLPAAQQRTSAELGRPRRRYAEHQLQVDVANFFAAALPPRHPDVWWTSIDHANARDARTGALRLARGVKAGIPDVMILFRGRAIFIELKTKAGFVSEEQSAVRHDIERAGGYWHLARSLDQVQKILLLHQIPLMAVIS